MLLGSFKESGSNIVALSYPSIVLKDIVHVEYCCSDAICRFTDFLGQKPLDKDLRYDDPDNKLYDSAKVAAEILRNMVTTASAADFF
jgi:hypothetical protein